MVPNRDPDRVHQPWFRRRRDCLLAIRPLPFDEWVRGAAAVAVQTLVFPSDN
jgi:hypothetical protein